MASNLEVIGEDCIGCGLCLEMCPATPCVFEMQDITAIVVHPEECERCMLCVENCPTNAIKMAKLEDMTVWNDPTI
jgi:NAD-dependent dihydropyrimidine dehydrogenase PreA subunit